MPKRRKTPQDIETEVLTMSARRCCVCFGVQMDMSIKKGQLAHLDGDPSNSEFDNLAYLCIPHHDDYDSKTSQSKGLTIHEVKSYRTLLYEAIRQMRKDLSPEDTEQNNKSFEADINNPEISNLLSKVQSRTVPLAQCFVEGVDLARKLRDSSLEKFCRDELSGYMGAGLLPLDYRIIDIFISGNARINMQSPLWGESAYNVFEYMRQDTENFIPSRIFVAQSIPTIESRIQNTDFQKGIIKFSLKMRDINPKAKKPDAELVGYAHPTSFQGVLEAVRRELTVALLNLLPSLENK